MIAAYILKTISFWLFNPEEMLLCDNDTCETLSETEGPLTEPIIATHRGKKDRSQLHGEDSDKKVMLLHGQRSAPCNKIVKLIAIRITIIFTVATFKKPPFCKLPSLEGERQLVKFSDRIRSMPPYIGVNDAYQY